MSESNSALAALIAGLGPVDVVEERCGVTELLVEQCAHCRKVPDPAVEGAAGLGPWISARYRGKCSGCGLPFDVFDDIRGDGAGGWLARCCDNYLADLTADNARKARAYGAPASIVAELDAKAARYAGPPPSTVAEMREVLTALDASRARSIQTALGPSELGTPCQRQIAMKLAGVPRQLPDKRPPWAPMQGTAMHTLMEEALRFHNAQLGRERWIIEDALQITDDIPGHGDAYDTDTGTVIDWKYVGVTALREVKRKTVPNEQLVKSEYRTQAHLYGYGHARKGRDVRWVRLVFLARSHDYDDSAEWTEPYQPEIAEDAILRYYATKDHLVEALDLANNPALWPVVPAAPSEKTCAWCPFHRPGPAADATGCPGFERVNKTHQDLLANI